MRYLSRFLHLLVLLVLAWAVTGAVPIAADQPNQVGLVMQFSDDKVITRCVEFDEAEISGYEVLIRAGLDVVANYDSGVGMAICALDGLGCPASDCFCECKGSPCRYWIYYHLSNGQWVYSSLGAGAYNVRDGDVEGWVWGVSTQQGGAQPPAISFDQICTPAATDTPVPPTPTSVPPTTTPTLLPSAQAWFRLDANPVPLGVCTTVRWDASYVDYVFLGDESVDISGSREICPDGPVDLTLLVGNEYSKQTYTLTLGVTIADDGAATLSPTATPTSQPVKDTTLTASATEPVPSPSVAESAISALVLTATLQPTEMSAPSLSSEPRASSTSTPIPATDALSPATNRPISTVMPSVEPTTWRAVVTSETQTPFPWTRYMAFAGIAGVLLVGLGWSLRRHKA